MTTTSLCRAPPLLSARAEKLANRQRPRPLLILDLDETLVHTTEAPLVGLTADFKVADLHVHLRPHVLGFLADAQAHYDLAIWSAGGSGYVLPTVDWLFALAVPDVVPLFVWSSNRCTRRFDHETHQEYYIKDLKKVRKKGYDARRLLIVDDLQLNSQRNFGNAVYVRPFTGDADDRELPLLSLYLQRLAVQPDFRTIEKRYWRDSVKAE